MKIETAATNQRRPGPEQAFDTSTTFLALTIFRCGSLPLLHPPCVPVCKSASLETAKTFGTSTVTLPAVSVRVCVAAHFEERLPRDPTVSESKRIPRPFSLDFWRAVAFIQPSEGSSSAGWVSADVGHRFR